MAMVAAVLAAAPPVGAAPQVDGSTAVSMIVIDGCLEPLLSGSEVVTPASIPSLEGEGFEIVGAADGFEADVSSVFGFAYQLRTSADVEALGRNCHFRYGVSPAHPDFRAGDVLAEWIENAEAVGRTRRPDCPPFPAEGRPPNLKMSQFVAAAAAPEVVIMWIDGGVEGLFWAAEKRSGASDCVRGLLQ
ncbi:MAG: hypothetical protein AAFU61_13185 [Pseudomonadota bacterium]